MFGATIAALKRMSLSHDHIRCQVACAIQSACALVMVADIFNTRCKLVNTSAYTWYGC